MSDVHLLAQGLEQFYRKGSEAGLQGYTAAALKRIWRAEYLLAQLAISALRARWSVKIVANRNR